MDKKVKLIACSEGDSSVGIQGFCETFEAELSPDRIKITSVNKQSDYEPIDEFTRTNLVHVSDNELEKALLPLFKELDDFDSVMTEASKKKYNEYLHQQGEEQYMRDLSEMGYQERDRHFKTQYKPKERERVQQQFQTFKKKLGK